MPAQDDVTCDTAGLLPVLAVLGMLVDEEEVALLECMKHSCSSGRKFHVLRVFKLSALFEQIEPNEIKAQIS